jgi:hypothetical protein
MTSTIYRSLVGETLSLTSGIGDRITGFVAFHGDTVILDGPDEANRLYIREDGATAVISRMTEGRFRSKRVSHDEATAVVMEALEAL